MSIPHWQTTRPAVNLGYLPFFLDNENPRSAVEQLHANYTHGGGWNDFHGFELIRTGQPQPDYPWHGSYTLRYPDDPPYEELARTHLHDSECIVLFSHDWVAVIQKDGNYRVARMD